MPSDDTIFALSSGAPPSAIAVIRISGPRSFDAVRQLARRLPKPRRASLSQLRNSSGDFLDEALVLTFPGPDSATGEDLAELHLHGGRAVIRAVEAELAKVDGLRRAEAGEFTRRAFLNGRIDLNEAEGLSDLLAAETERQRRSAAQMAGGRFGEAVEKWRGEILRLSALVEADLDFGDEDDVSTPNTHLISNGCIGISREISTLLAQPPAEKLRDGLRIVLGGPPNSGKSTLLNALVEREAAIVSDIAGTTRDVIEVPVSFSGIPLLLIDTAGLRDKGGDEIEAIGIKRAQAAFDDADMVLWLGPESEGPTHPQLIEIAAKCDDPAFVAKGGEALSVSAAKGEGLGDLVSAIAARAAALLPPEDGFAVNRRQREQLAIVDESLKAASKAEDGLVIAEELRQARRALDRLTGRAHTEDMLDALFGKFCIGK